MLRKTPVLPPKNDARMCIVMKIAMPSPPIRCRMKVSMGPWPRYRRAVARLTFRFKPIYASLKNWFKEDAFRLMLPYENEM